MDYIKKGRITIKFSAEKGSMGVYIPEVNSERPEYEVLFAYHSKVKRKSLFEFIILSENN